jgi:hypothetical protein
MIETGLRRLAMQRLLKGSQEPLRTLFSVSRVYTFRNNDIVPELRQMLRRPFEEVGRHHANRSGITTPIPIAKNHRAGAECRPGEGGEVP